MNFLDKDLISIQEARAIVTNAKDTQYILSNFKQENLDDLIEKVYKVLKENIYVLSCLYVEETCYGNKADEEKNISMLLNKLYFALKPLKCSGVIREDIDKKVLDIAVSRGIVLLLVSPVNTVSCIITAILNCIKSGSTLIIAPDERVINTTKKIVGIVNEELRNFGFLQDIVSSLQFVTSEGIRELIQSSDTSTIINQMQKEYIKDCNCNAKLFIYGSGGASPVFIEKTADIEKATFDIIQSRSFNNGILPASEQYVIVDVNIAKKVKDEMIKNGAYFMTSQEDDKIKQIILKNGNMDKEYIGKSANYLANMAGLDVPKNIKVLVSEKEYISEQNPYITEIIAPVLAFYVENDWINACEKCISLLKGVARGHCLVIHSKDKEVIKEFAIKKPVGRFLVNAKASFSAMGINANLFPSAILGGFTCNVGSISQNLNPNLLIYERKVAYESENMKDVLSSISSDKSVKSELEKKIRFSDEKCYDDDFRNMLLKISKLIK